MKTYKSPNNTGKVGQSLKKEILLVLTAWMDLDGIMLSEMNQIKTNTKLSHLHVEMKQTKKNQTQNSMLVASSGGWVVGERCQKIQISSSKYVLGMYCTVW